MTSNTTLYVTDYNSHPEIKHFVNIYCWSKPLSNIVEGKVFKKGNKLLTLVSQCGRYGPIIDLVIRGTIPHMIVLNIGENTSCITDKQNGCLKIFLEGHFKDKDLIDTITKWFQFSGNVRDYDTAYRHYRQTLLVSQLDKLLWQPYRFVSDCFSL